MKKLIKKLSILIGCFALILSSGLLVACGDKDPKPTNKITTSKDLYGFAAVTTGMVLDSVSSSNPSPVADYNQAYAEQLIEQVNSYIGLFERFVGGSAPIHTEKATVEEEHNNFANKIIVTTTNLAGETDKYYIYYTEGTPTKVDGDDPSEYKMVTNINGILLLDETSVALTGTKTVEEDETELVLVASLNGAQVRFSQEFEEGETEYKYEIKEGNHWYEMFSFEIEIKNNKTEIELSAYINGEFVDFEIEQIKIDGVKYLEVSYTDPDNAEEIDDIKIKIVEEGENSYYQYILPNGQTINKIR